MRIDFKDKTTFGIYKGHKATSYGSYTWGIYRNKKVEVYNDKIRQQKLIYISDNQFLKWIKSKLVYFQNGIRKVNISNGR